MTQSASHRRPSFVSAFLGVLYCAVCWAIGYASSTFSEILRSFGRAETWQFHVLASIHLVPTVIFGVSAAALIIWKDRIANRRSSHYINAVALVSLLLIAGLWAYVAFSPL